MRNVLIASFGLLFVVSAAAQIGPRGDRFDGKWAVTLTSDDGKSYEDTLIFDKGKFSSKQSKQKGFEEVEYEVDTRGGQASTFTANAKSKKEGTAKWSGTVAVSEITGTMEWTKADGSVVSYTYRGSRGEKK